jgi:lipoprotein-anchoring transpeptidase ErfK/SrfK
LGRVLATLTLRKRPDSEAAELGKKFQDNIVEILREVVGKGPRADPHNHRWFETPEGYLWAPWVYPMEFQPQQPSETIPGGKAWAEVTVPWVQGRSAPSDFAPVIMLESNGLPLTLYYASIYIVKKAVKDETGQVWYQLEDSALSMYARADGLRLITSEELTPISPEVDDKLVVVNLRRRMKTITALENDKEVFYAVIASGGTDPETGLSSTPPGDHPIWRKCIGKRMSGNAGGGYDLPGVGWISLFGGPGEGIHSTYWHNDYGIEKSHGCVNARPEDAKWLFRWTQPAVQYPEGDVTISGKGSTMVRVLT